MLNITTKVAFLAACGALLGAASNSTQAANAYNAPSNQTYETAKSTPHYWPCPAQYRSCPTDAPTVTAKTEKATRTDAGVWDAPDQGVAPIEDSRYYDYSRMILGD